MAKTIKKALEQNKHGFYIGQRIILPFRCQIIKIMMEGKILTEVVGSEDIKIQQDPKNTSIYVRSIGRLATYAGSYKVIKLILCEWEDDLCDLENHIKLVCEIQEGHKVTIKQKEPDDDMLFLE